MEITQKKLNGSITIFLSLTITIILSLIFCTIESARITCIKSRTKAVTYMALDSSFCHFAKQLYEEYGILGVFTTEEDFLSMTQNYIEKNINPTSYNSFLLTKASLSDIEYNTIYHITDNNGLYFANQVAQYEQYRCISENIDKIKNLSSQYDDSSITAPGDSSDGSFNISSEDAKKYEAVYKTKDYGLSEMSSKDAASLKDNILSKVYMLLSSNLLHLLVDDASGISSACINDDFYNKLPSKTCFLATTETGTIYTDSEISDTVSCTPVTLKEISDFALFQSYIDNSFSSYKQTDVNPSMSLKYQREYILCGKQSDHENLKAAALSIINLRAGANLTYLLSDSSKREAAFTLGNSICGGLPIISTTTSFAILSAWAYAESIIDVRDLFDNKSVPLIKDDSCWTLDLDSILSLGKDTISKNTGDNGLSYNDYLRLCLLNTSSEKLYYRTMDLIQTDICENVNPNFTMDACIIGACINVDFSSDALFSNIIELASPDSYNFEIDSLYAYD